MADGHQRYERLAVGHVVGGLDTVDAARFRSHLTGCAHCRTRVSELRDIANDLAETERDERTSRAGGTEVATRADREAPPRIVDVAPMRDWPWRMVAFGLIPMLILLVLAWAIWVRTENQVLAAVANSQQQTLSLLASGDEVPLVTSDGVDAIAAAGAERVGLFLTGVPELGADQGLVVWLLDDLGSAVHVSDPLLRTRLVGGEVMLTIPRAVGATQVVVSIERLPGELTVPTGLRVASGPLRGLLMPAPASTDSEL